MGPDRDRSSVAPTLAARVRRRYESARDRATVAAQDAWQSRRAETLLLTALTGVVTGAIVAVLDFVIRDRLLDWVVDRPLWLLAILPTIGVLLAAVALRVLAGGASPTTADEYVRNYHEPGRRLDITELPGRMVAAIATVGLGAPLGVEGTAAYAGGAIGGFTQHRFSGFFSRSDAKQLLVAGAAAGVAAIFRAPATGALYALEVPYRRDIVSRAAVPAIVAAVTAFLTFSLIRGTRPLFGFAGSGVFEREDLPGIILLGLLCGVGARLFIAGINVAKRLATDLPLDARLALAAVVFVTLVVLADEFLRGPLVLGVGYNAVAWGIDPDHGLGLVALLLLLRSLGTMTAIGAGGVGGLFVPLVVSGALIGRLVGGAFPAEDAALYPMAGMAAFLGAGFRTPFAAVMFVAETTHGAGFVAPALVAVAAAQLVMGRSSIVPFQRATRAGVLDRRLYTPVADVLRADAYTCGPSVTVAELLDSHFLSARSTTVPVVDGPTYRGLVELDDAVALDPTLRDKTTAADIMRIDLPAVPITATLAEAVAVMDGADVDALAVIDDDDEDSIFVGTITTADIVRLDGSLGTLEP